jgi:hypothetical protein
MIDLFGGFFQQGYVTTDTERAVALYRERFGVSDWLIFDTSTVSADSHMLVALAWVGATQIELIQPLGDTPPLYAGLLPRDEEFAIRFHHMGYLTEDPAHQAALVAEVERQHLPIATRREGSGVVDLIYADFRPVLGHYCEFVLAYPKGKAFLDSVPRNPG